MIPYIHIEPFSIGSLVVPPFGVLVGLSIVVGYELSLWRGRRLGLDASELGALVWAFIIGGLVGGHVLDALLYYPMDVLARPWILFEIWNGLGSFSGFAGALLGGLFWKYYEWRRTPGAGFLRRLLPVRRATPASLIRYADAVFAVFPVTWFLGRMGCSIVHDHPGIMAPEGSWLAVAFGPGPVERFGFIELHYGTQPRYDLGFLEMVFAGLLALFFALTWRTKRTCGWYIAMTWILYAPVRFVLDFLRVDDPIVGDPRYGGLTPAQWGCMAGLVFGLAILIRIHAGAKNPGVNA